MRIQNTAPVQLTGGIRLFKIFGITVFLHVTWFLVLIYEVQWRHGYHTIIWNALEVMAVFAIILLHEFGHALACRSVGGQADRIMLWPLGGVAFVRPPDRAGAMLWSIAAGPLVNVLLMPVLLPFFFHQVHGDLGRFLYTVATINIIILAFNLLPIYPLDGGQILRSVLWFMIGKSRSLMVATVIGMCGAIAVAGIALYASSFYLGIMAALGVWQCWIGFKYARELRVREKQPRRLDMQCPNCHVSPPLGPMWICSTCGARFDAFEHQTVCPGCGKLHSWTTCLNCGAQTPFQAWQTSPAGGRYQIEV